MYDYDDVASGVFYSTLYLDILRIILDARKLRRRCEGSEGGDRARGPVKEEPSSSKQSLLYRFDSASVWWSVSGVCVVRESRVRAGRVFYGHF